MSRTLSGKATVRRRPTTALPSSCTAIKSRRCAAGATCWAASAYFVSAPLCDCHAAARTRRVLNAIVCARRALWAAMLYGLGMLAGGLTQVVPVGLGLRTIEETALAATYGSGSSTWMILFGQRAAACSLVFPLVGYTLMQCPFAFAYYLSHRCAVILAQNEVGRVAIKIRAEALADDETWSTDVARPALRLATDTIAYLSCWGGGTALVFVAAILFAVLHFVLMVHNIYAPWEAKVMSKWDAADGEYNPLMNFIPCLAGVTIPILLSRDVAHISVSRSIDRTNRNRPQPPHTSPPPPHPSAALAAATVSVLYGRF